MADISRISRLLNGVQRGIDLPNNSLVMQSLKVSSDGGSTSTELTKTILDQLITHRISDGSDHSIVVSNQTHATGDGSDHADVATNTTHSTGDGSDHADVASNTTHSTGDGSDHADVASNTTHRTSNGSDHSYVGNLQSLSGVAAGSADLGSFTGSTIPDSQTMKQALQALETYAEASRSLINNFEWLNSAKDYIADNTQAPPTEVSGDRYILSHDGGSPHADWDGASAGDVVEFDGSSWNATTPSLGTFISADDEADVLYYWGGSSWASKAFESTTASTGLTKSSFDIQLADAAAANGIQVSSGAISAVVDDSSIEINGSNQIAIKTGGVSNAEVAADAAIVESKLSLDYSTSSLNTAVSNAQSEIDGIETAMGSVIDSNGDYSAHSGTNYIDGNSNVTEDLTDLDTQVKSNTDAIAAISVAAIKEDLVAGESFLSANAPFAVRWGVTDLDTPETAGRVYKADPTELSLVKSGGNKDPFHVIGIANPASDVAASESMEVVKHGPVTVSSHGLAVGEPIYLDSSGALTNTAPSAASEAVVKVGVAKDANVIDVAIEIMGVN